MSASKKLAASMKVSREEILEHFPADKRLAYDDFITDEITRFYYQDEEKIRKIYELISCPWTEIQWSVIEKIPFLNDEETTDFGYAVIGALNEKSFIHVFPSLLAEATENDCMTNDYFIRMHLDLRSVYKDWELEFYFSFNEEIVKLIYRILSQYGCHVAKDAIYVYWHERGKLPDD
ncbi:MAG: hypothetical protein LBV29_04025 [Azoarcus sp.]|jgi:hypothetical protein|nr:hypothetical protein [Azoarcus sp.]